jgi:phytoene dehydrogenase-like protein
MRTLPLLLALSLSFLACSHQGDKRQISSASYPIEVLGGDENSFTPAVGSPIENPGRYDTIIVGGGMAGMSAAVYLTDKNKKVLLLEKEEGLGGLASSGTFNGSSYDRGTAYFTDTYEEEKKILDHIGMGEFKKEFAIHEPIDSYLWNGKLFEGFWEPHAEEVLASLPASFSLFKHEMQILNQTGQIANQPFEEFACNDIDKKTKAARKKFHMAAKMDDCYRLDSMNVAQWLRNMPAQAARRPDAESKKNVARLKKEIAAGRVQPADPMRDLVDFLDLYCRSALGANTSGVSAMAFVNFYISELETRYTSPTGTGIAITRMFERLKARGDLAEIITSASVGQIENKGNVVEVLYVAKGKTYRAKADYLVFAAQSKLAPKLIAGLNQKDPEKAAAMKSIEYANYSVHGVHVKGHPYRATYDTWTRASDYTEEDFTDVILGRWMAPEINGYLGMRDFRKNPSDDSGVLTIYHPLGQKFVGQGYTKEQAREAAQRATERMIEIYSPLLRENWGTKIDVVSVETSRWPFAVHVTAPGHFRNKAKLLRRNFGRIFFAHSNLGTPAFEEALYRGHCAANNVLKRMNPSFVQESWTKCPLETGK